LAKLPPKVREVLEDFKDIMPDDLPSGLPLREQSCMRLSLSQEVSP